MSVLAVTGPSRLGAEEARIRPWLREALRHADRLRTGGAFGVDTIAAEEAVALGVPVTLVQPSARFNPAVRDLADEVEYAPAGRTYAEAYMLRNDLLLVGADRLLGVVRREDLRYRSGECATVRRAAALPVDLLVAPRA